MTRPLRILLISSTYRPESGDAIWTCTAIAGEALAARGHEVHLLSCVPGAAASDERYRGTYLHRRGLLRIRGLGRITSLLQAPRAVARIHVGLSTYLEARRLGVDFDVVEYPDWEAEGLIFALTREKPMVAYLHTPLPLIRQHANLVLNRDLIWASALEHFAVRRAHAVTSPSQLLLTTLRQAGWRFPQAVEVIPNPIDWALWEDSGPVAATDPIVLYVGTLERRKAPEVLVEAMRMVRQVLPGARAIFAGSSNGMRDGIPYLQWLQKSAETAGCEFTGHVPRERLKEMVSKARVLAVPSRFDNYSLVVAEAMSAGRPVVLTSSNGISDFVRESGAGTVVPPENPGALAEALLPLLRDPELASAVGARARAAARESLDPGRIASLREAVYYDAIDRFRRRSSIPEQPLRKRVPDSRTE